MHSTAMRSITEQYALNESDQNTLYDISFNDAEENRGKNQVISVNSKREVEIMLLALGDKATVVMDIKAQEEHPDVWNWLRGRSIEDILNELKWSFKEGNELQQLIGKIPVPQSYSSIIQNPEMADKIEQIDQKYVHKLNRANVLISEPYQCGNMFYFKGFTSSPEFIIDHPSDHLEGIVLFEAARQTSIASIHLAGLPLLTRLIMLRANIKYVKFVDINKPYFIRSIPVVKQKGGSFYIVFEIIQDGSVSATGKMDGFSFKNKEHYERIRKYN